MARVKTELDANHLVVSAEACTLDRLYGQFRGNDDTLLMLFDAKTLASIGPAPIVAPIRVYGATSFEQTFDSLKFLYGCVAVFCKVASWASDETVAAEDGATQVGSITAEGEGFATTAVWTVTDSSEGVTDFGVDNHKKLRRLTVTTSSTDDVCLILCRDYDASIAEPGDNAQYFKLPSDSTIELDFGEDGLSLSDGFKLYCVAYSATNTPSTEAVEDSLTVRALTKA